MIDQYGRERKIIRIARARMPGYIAPRPYLRAYAWQVRPAWRARRRPMGPTRAQPLVVGTWNAPPSTCARTYNQQGRAVGGGRASAGIHARSRTALQLTEEGDEPQMKAMKREPEDVREGYTESQMRAVTSTSPQNRREQARENGQQQALHVVQIGRASCRERVYVLV